MGLASRSAASGNVGKPFGEAGEPPGETDGRQVDRLILVYAARSGRLAAWIDSVRKLLGVPGCALCAVTHGLAGEKGEWKKLKSELRVPVDSVHRDEVEGRLQAEIGDRVPCVVACTEGRLIVLLPPQVVSGLDGSVAALERHLGSTAASLGLGPLIGPR